MSQLKKISKYAGIAALCVSPLAQSAHAEEQRAYRRLLNALEKGKDVTAVVDFRRCTVGEGETPGAAITGGFHIRAFIVPGGKYIAFSNVHDTLSPQRQPVTEYLRYKVMPNGNVTVAMTAVAEGAKKPLNENTYFCNLGDGVRFVW